MRDDLGDKPGEFDPTTDTWLIVDCGRRAAFEYQRQLYEDFDLAGDGSVPRVARAGLGLDPRTPTPPRRLSHPHWLSCRLATVRSPPQGLHGKLHLDVCG